jgi:DNA-binding response OmpR family regulator
MTRATLTYPAMPSQVLIASIVGVQPGIILTHRLRRASASAWVCVVASIIASMLTTSGYEVETTNGGADAYSMYCDRLSEGKTFDFVLASGLMLDGPGMSGPDLLESIRRKNPSQRCGLCTTQRGLTFPAHQVLLKPFDKAQLIAFVKKSLDPEGGA